MARTENGMSNAYAGKSYLVYPQSPEFLGDYDAFIKLTSYKYNNTLYGTNSQIFSDKSKEKDKNVVIADLNNQIFLPIPNEGLNITDTVDYEGIKGGATLPKKFLNLFAEGMRTNLQMVAAYEDFLKAQAGGALNNFMANLFNGMTLREFVFSWEFIPYSQQDSHVLKQLIIAIRKAALPLYDNNSWSIKFPDFWIVEPYVNGKLLYELNFLVLSDIKLSYDNSSTGTTFFNDGTPVSTRLSLTFKEVYPAGSELISY